MFPGRSAPVRFRQILFLLFPDLNGKREKVYVLTVLHVLSVSYVLECINGIALTVSDTERRGGAQQTRNMNLTAPRQESHGEVKTRCATEKPLQQALLVRARS
ncbi:hypothetical protein JM238_004976 [Salmonella enterica]|nr:hypothetical protein [Salmonella enterica]